MALRKAYAQPLTLIVLAHSPAEARESAGRIARSFGGVIDTVDEVRNSRRFHLNYSTADLHEIPRVVQRRGR